MWRVQSNIVLLLSILSLTATVHAKTNVPDWLRSAAANKYQSPDPDTKLVWLLDETDYTVIAPGDFIEHSRTIAKILRPDGRKYVDLSVSYRKDEKMESIHAWAIDAAGNEYELKDKDFTEKGEFDFELYDDYVERAAPAPALQPGTVIAFDYTIKRHEWINELGWRFQGEFPVAQSVLTVALPSGWEYRASWSGGTPVEPKQTGPNIWEWRQENVAGIENEREPMMPPPFVLANRMSVAYFAPNQKSATSASWQQVGSWYSTLVKDRPTATPDIVSKTTELIAGKPDFDSKLVALTRFVQSEIRYVAVEIGIGGDQPHPADDVFRHRYGDCKDKVTLLKSMLQIAGISSYYVLIDTHRGFINPSVPSSWGNHAIIAIELPDSTIGRYQSLVTSKANKRFIIFDPTDEYTPVGSLRSELQSSYALMIADSGGELIKTPLLAPDSSVVTRTGKFVLSPEGKLSGDVMEDESGNFASSRRMMLHYSDERERDHLISGWLGRSIQGFSLDKIEIQQADELQKDLKLSYRVTTSLYGQSRGPLLLVRPRVLGDDSYYVEHKPRHYPVELRRTGRETDTYEIELPQGYVVDDLPDPVKIDVGFASYQSRINVEGNKLRYWREYVVRDLSIPPEKYGDWTRLEGVIGADESSMAILKQVH